MYRKFIYAVFFWFLISSCVDAQINSLAIGGPHEVEPGTLVRLVAETQAEETPFWLVLSPSDLDYEQVESGHRLIFPAGCVSGKEIVVLLLAQQVKDGRIVTRQLRRTIDVSIAVAPDIPIAPPDPRGPEHDAPPLVPVEDWAQSPVFKATKRALSQVPDNAKKQFGLKVADNFDFVAQRCLPGGDISTRKEVWLKISQLNRELLGTTSTEWSPIGRELQIVFQKLNLPDVPSHRFHLQAAALAIRQELSAQSPVSEQIFVDPASVYQRNIPRNNSRLP